MTETRRRSPEVIDDIELYFQKRNIKLEFERYCPTVFREHLMTAVSFLPDDFFDTDYVKSVNIGDDRAGLYISNQGALLESGDLYVLQDVIDEFHPIKFYQTFFHEVGHIVERKVNGTRINKERRELIEGDQVVVMDNGRFESNWKLKEYDIKTGEAIVVRGQEGEEDYQERRETANDLQRWNLVEDIETYNMLNEAYETIKARDAFRSGMFMEYTEGRIAVQQQELGQFIAEFNKMFIMEGEELQEFISKQGREVQDAYDQFYGYFKNEVYQREFSHKDAEKMYIKSTQTAEKAIDEYGNWVYEKYREDGAVDDWVAKRFKKRTGMEFEEWANMMNLDL